VNWRARDVQWNGHGLTTRVPCSQRSPFGRRCASLSQPLSSDDRGRPARCREMFDDRDPAVGEVGRTGWPWGFGCHDAWGIRTRRGRARIKGSDGCGRPRKAIVRRTVGALPAAPLPDNRSPAGVEQPNGSPERVRAGVVRLDRQELADGGLRSPRIGSGQPPSPRSASSAARGPDSGPRGHH